MDAREVILSAGRSTPPKSCCARKCTGSAFRPRWAPSSAATAISSDWPTTATWRPTYWDMEWPTSRARTIRRSPGRTSWAWCGTRPACRRTSGSRSKIFRSRAPTWRRKAVFGMIRGQDTVTGNEKAQSDRLGRDMDPLGQLHDPNGAMNHSMLYLVMGQDNARGTILFEAPWTEPDGRIRVSWDQAGQQQIFTRMNGELRRHARALRGELHSQPYLERIPTRPPDYGASAGRVPHGRRLSAGRGGSVRAVYAGDGSVHSGLYVTDGSVMPSALGVNPLHDDLRADGTLRRAQDPATGRQSISATGRRQSAWQESIRWT